MSEPHRAEDTARTGQESESGGRWNRTPYRPEVLQEQYGTSDDHTSDRLDVTCPGCGKNWCPVSSCCIKGGSRSASPFCPNCGVDFRADVEDVEQRTRFHVETKTDEAAARLRQFVKDERQMESVRERTRWTETTEGAQP